MLTHRTSDRLFTRSHYRYESKRGLGVLPPGRGRGTGYPRARYAGWRAGRAAGP